MTRKLLLATLGLSFGALSMTGAPAIGQSTSADRDAARAAMARNGMWTSRIGRGEEPGEAAAAIGEAAAKILYGYIIDSSCYRHFYNKTNSVWKVIPSAEVRKLGMCKETGVCEIPPQTEVRVWYPNLNRGDEGEEQIRIVGPGYDATYWVHARDNCVYIDHEGRTGRAVLNDPANGDIVFID